MSVVWLITLCLPCFECRSTCIPGGWLSASWTTCWTGSVWTYRHS